MHIIKPGLSRIKKFLKIIGNPHLKRDYILVGGTNGKGSISTVISSILQFSGYKTGLYTSPHLIDVTERIKIDKFNITPETLDDILDWIFSISQKIKIELSYFELLTVSAFIYFDRNEIDIGILEVGMGGRWDATNVINPMITVITNVSLDHEQYLGSKIKEIALEKAEIIKKNGTVVTSCGGESIDVIRNKCREMSAKLYELDKDFKCKIYENNKLQYSGLNIVELETDLKIKGICQIKNIAISIYTTELLNKYFNYNICDKTITNTIPKIKLEGRIEYIDEDLPIILDGCHNIASVENLVESLQHYHPEIKFSFLVTMLEDKNIEGFLKRLEPLALRLIITEIPDSSRSIYADNLGKLLKKFSFPYEIIKSPIEAYNKILSYDEPLVVCGSLYLIGYLKKYLLNEKTGNN